MRAPWRAPALVLLLGCSGTTELVIVVDSDLSVPRELDEIAFEVVGPEGETAARSATLSGQGAASLPVTLVVLHRGGPLGPVEIHASGRLRGREIVSRDAVARFVPGRAVLVPLELSRSCLGASCPAGTCVDGACVDPRLEPTPVPSDVDAAPPLGEPRADAGPPRGGGGTSATDAGSGCGDHCVCRQSCEDGCTCERGCQCDLRCAPGDDCESGRCSDEGTTCALRAREASDLTHTCERGARCDIDARLVSNVDVRCDRGASCVVDCTGASDCDVRCEREADCLVDCSGTSDCRVRGCEDALRSCDRGVVACRRSCP